MGSWNKTCGISNLHIHAGTPVYAFVIEENPHHDRCYSTAFWRPLMLPFASVYNDYGGGEDNNETLQFIINGLKNELVEMPLGENQCHDIAVSADAMTEDLFFEAIHEGRLFVKDRAFGGERKVDLVMMRKDVVDHICENWQCEVYVGSGKGTSGYGNNYVRYKFADVLALIPEFTAKVRTELLDTPADDRDALLPPELRMKYAFRGLNGLYAYEDRNLISIYLSGIDDYRFSRIVRPTDLVVQLLGQGDDAKATEIIKDVLLASFINSFMDLSRKLWIPAGHEGSQSDEHSPYRVLISAMENVLDKEKARWEEENEGDFDD